VDRIRTSHAGTIAALWRKRSPAVVLAGLLWCAGVAVTVVNVPGYVGEHIEQYQAARETRTTERSMAMERLPLRGGLVLSLAFALATASARRMATA
jgi:hypothetical protein